MISSLPVPDFSKCIITDQNNRSESNSPISPTGGLSQAMVVSLNICSPNKAASVRLEKIIQLLKSVERKYHKLSDHEITPIARLIDKKFSGPQMPGQVLELVNKKGDVSRTILLELDTQIAYIFLKTKGGLTRVHGGFKTGTRVLEVKWQENPAKMQVDKSFLLVLRDDKQHLYSDDPTFEESVLSKIPELYEYVVLNKVGFCYEKVKKETGERIRKSASIYPFMPKDLDAHFKLPGIQYHHMTAAMFGVAECLKYLHKAGISHGDVKGANILVDENGRPKLADFDFGTVYTSQTRSISRHAYGTLRYTAPEHLVCQDVMTLDLPALDAWAYGIMLHPYCYRQFKQLRELKVLYKTKKMEPAADTERNKLAVAIEDKVHEIYTLQMANQAAAESAAVSILHVLEDEKISDEQKYKNFLVKLGQMMLHPDAASRPTFKQIVKMMNRMFQIVR